MTGMRSVPAVYTGPEMPPSLRTRQKWTAIRNAAIERDADAVEHVEAQQRAGADEPAAEQREPRVVGGRDELDVPDLEQTRARAPRCR